MRVSFSFPWKPLGLKLLSHADLAAQSGVGTAQIILRLPFSSPNALHAQTQEAAQGF
ncbi:hypothetical protein [Desulfitobacterium hafniense]|uniref:hypothetical protein n=1 Tax=Desulfitobacterium hafniense TaxID=49338 RepID=UPI0003631BF5|nr:hypothetical protein [Desulfitobacterium hafniense]